MTRALWMLTLLFLALPVACSHGSGGPVRQADGGYELSCKGPLSDCLRHAERLCRDDGYTVTEARDVRDLLGHESGQSQVMIEKSGATIYCGSHPTRAPIELKRETPLEPAAPSPAVAPLAPPPVEAKPAPACVPGATQTCVGPGGCSGGQACKADGTGYDPCNCGN
jgi:hypothetical protein